MTLSVVCSKHKSYYKGRNFNTEGVGACLLGAVLAVLQCRGFHPVRHHPCCCCQDLCVALLQVLNNMQGHKQRVASFAKRWAQVAKQQAVAPSQQILTTGNCVQDPATHKYVVAPAVDGRISMIGPEAAAAAAAGESAAAGAAGPGST
jgi:hypothetical protein